MRRGCSASCDLVATFDDDGTEIAGGDVLVDGDVDRSGRRRAVRPTAATASIDGAGLVVLPGLVNAHQHLYQGATRAIPRSNAR